ncbi:MAG: 2-amino-4-hydroxy-6-hydroxymethyldihydropteridine diphosphokinase [Fimbriimonas sp.]|nr:2-amino-4-hydroxy-6-hydroxymethyldihydropteridine diphosphokinase [Fimbriimonas sp.]
MAEVLIALGTNVGDRLENLRTAVRRLAEEFGQVEPSAIYETAPMYVVHQPPFLNAAVKVESSIGPMAVLTRLKALEKEIGRQQRERCGPREIDLDLIAYGALCYRYQDKDRTLLQVPHPRLAERRFVLQPLADVAPNFHLPGLGVVSALLKQTEHQADSVKKSDHALLPIQRQE